MPQMFDYAQMMGISDLGPEQQIPPEDDMAEAMFSGRETFVQNPEIHQDYTGVNPYEDDAHGAWQEGVSSFLEGLGNPYGSGEAMQGLQLDLPNDTEDPEGTRDELIEEDQANAELSEEYQNKMQEG